MHAPALEDEAVARVLRRGDLVCGQRARDLDVRRRRVRRERPRERVEPETLLKHCRQQVLRCVHAHVVEPALQPGVAELHADVFAGLECRECVFNAFTAELDVVYSVPADSLDLGDLPHVAVRTGQEPDIRRLPAALGEEHGVM